MLSTAELLCHLLAQEMEHLGLRLRALSLSGIMEQATTSFAVRIFQTVRDLAVCTFTQQRCVHLVRRVLTSLMDVFLSTLLILNPKCVCLILTAIERTATTYIFTEN